MPLFLLVQMTHKPIPKLLLLKSLLFHLILKHLIMVNSFSFYHFLHDLDIWSLFGFINWVCNTPVSPFILNQFFFHSLNQILVLYRRHFRVMNKLHKCPGVHQNYGNIASSQGCVVKTCSSRQYFR